MQIRKIKAEETREMRQLTLRRNQKASELVYPGDDAEQTVHFGAFEDEELAGIASLYKECMKDNDEIDSWRLRGMATSEKYRGKGLGKELMNQCLMHARINAGKIFWCNARISAEGFYQKFGMKRVSDVFFPENLGPHVVMMMNL